MSETIQGETIIIHLGTGSYYSLQGVGADVWSALTRGADRTQILVELVERYEVADLEAAQSVDALLAELQAEELVVDGPERELYQPAEASSERTEFVVPKVEKHTDMQDIILLDPVHEVDERGWPHVSEAAVS
jgi:hypothetical protein